MPTLPNASVTNSYATNPQDEPSRVATAKPTETYLSPSMEEWVKEAVKVSNRLSTDEPFRKEIAKRIT